MGSTGRAPTAALQADPMPAPRGVSGNLTGGPDGMAGAESMEQRAPEAKGEQGPWGSPSPTPPVSPLLLIPFNPRGDPCEGGSGHGDGCQFYLRGMCLNFKSGNFLKI